MHNKRHDTPYMHYLKFIRPTHLFEEMQLLLFQNIFIITVNSSMRNLVLRNFVQCIRNRHKKDIWICQSPFAYVEVPEVSI